MISICHSGIHHVHDMIYTSIRAIMQRQLLDFSRAPPPSLLCALCYGPAASTSKSCLFNLPFVCRTRLFTPELRAYISSTGWFFRSGFQVASAAASHPLINLPRTRPPQKSFTISTYAPEITGRTHVRLFFQLPAFSTELVTIYWHPAGIAKTLLSSFVLLSTCNWLLSFCFLRLLRFWLSFFFVPAIGSRHWCACCSCSAVTILRYIAIGSCATLRVHAAWASRLVLVLRSRSRYCDISLFDPGSADCSRFYSCHLGGDSGAR